MLHRLPVHTAPPYNVHIEEGLLTTLPALLKNLHAPVRLRLVADKAVYHEVGHALTEALEAAGFEVVVDRLVAGESVKTIDVWQRLLERWAAAGLNRSDLILSLGGGTISDLAGFAAATYMRGLGFVAIPTTLLAAIDASVGGKTGLNLKSGKNLVGVFAQPLAVCCDPQLFLHLPEDEWKNGLAELLKIAIVNDADLFERLRQRSLRPTDADLTAVLAAAIRAKEALVALDERDHGPRQGLNFGHSLGHAIENVSGYGIPHGQAVAMGMGEAARLAADHGYCDSRVRDAILDALAASGLPDRSPFALRDLVPAMLLDKKASDNDLTLILPVAIGRVHRLVLPKSDLLSFLTRGDLHVSTNTP